MMSVGNVDLTLRKLVLGAVMFAASSVSMYYTLKWVVESVGLPAENKSAKERSEKVMKRLGHKNLELTEHEEIIAAEVIHPDDIDVRFSDIGGLEPIVASLRESIIYPLVYPTLFTSASTLLRAPKGVLLYGPPGCGKTMLAKALAKESGATFINIAVSSLASKWFGESNRLVSGLFSLAKKLQPSIVFIDEIDSFLRERSSGDHEATAMMKAEFMTLWDGLTSSNDRILVLGATNRPTDIDVAILRRMPKRFAIALPDHAQRLKILSLLLRGTALDAGFPMDLLASQTEGLSGSDLKELCRSAAMVPVREYLRATAGDREALDAGQVEGFKLRPLRISDFVVDNPMALPIPDLAPPERARIEDVDINADLD